MGLLDEVLGGQQQSGTSPITKAIAGLLAYPALKSSGQASASANASNPAAPSSTPTGPAGLLGGLLGGAGTGSVLGQGLSALLQEFRNAGHGDKAESWVGAGANEPISPGELEQVLGPERIAWLVHHTGMSHDDLLKGLSQELPQAVDRLTPNGSVPQKADPSRIGA